MIKAITGTKDILPNEIGRWKYLEFVVSSIMEFNNYKEIRTPVFEETQLFSRGIGESTDIVSKEMYSFLDRSETSVTLKPEMTASVVRAFIEHSLDKKQSLNKLYYISPMFRQERPQAGRLRQFHQFGAEAMGSSNPLLDAEMIIIAYDILKSLGLENLSILINSLGIPDSRERYKGLLTKFLSDKLSQLSDESKKRFETNILRIFDSKDERDQEIMRDAPLLIEHLDDMSLEHFDKVKKCLLTAKIPFKVEPNLVRGLDYYTNTTFEIISPSVGAQNALCGGGRYDLLVEQLGGKPTPAVGFAAGIDRILLACENENSFISPENYLDIYLVRLEDDVEFMVYEIALSLRRKDIIVEFDYLNRSIKAQMREANKLNTKFVLFIGGEEFKVGMAKLKNMSSGEEEAIVLKDEAYYIKKIMDN